MLFSKLPNDTQIIASQTLHGMLLKNAELSCDGAKKLAQVVKSAFTALHEESLEADVLKAEKAILGSEALAATASSVSAQNGAMEPASVNESSTDTHAARINPILDLSDSTWVASNEQRLKWAENKEQSIEADVLDWYRGVRSRSAPRTHMEFITELCRGVELVGEYNKASAASAELRKAQHQELSAAPAKADEKIDVVGAACGKPIVNADTKFDISTIPWNKLSTPCRCGGCAFTMYLVNGDYKKDCVKCGLISLYSGVVLNTSPEVLKQSFRFPAQSPKETAARIAAALSFD